MCLAHSILCRTSGVVDRVDIRHFGQLDGVLLANLVKGFKQQSEKLHKSLSQGCVAWVLLPRDGITPVVRQTVGL